MFCGVVEVHGEPALPEQSQAIKRVVVVVWVRGGGRACRQTEMTSFPIQ